MRNRIDGSARRPTAQVARSRGGPSIPTEDGNGPERLLSAQLMQLFNPLPMALAHYEAECIDTLRRLGVPTRSVAPGTATDVQQAPLARRGLSHLRAVGASRRRVEPCLVMWPAFGWLEPLLWSGTRAPTQLIIHDPIAIRRQYGQGRALRALARSSLQRSRLELVCHTDEAAAATQASIGLAEAPRVMLHPILEPAAASHPRPRSTVVLVAGQYKPSRDLELLESLGPMLRSAGLQPTIRGRGWPPVEGWEVVSRFVSESDFEEALRASAVVLVPYTRYWQSNVAVRALESNVPIVGLKTHFLATLLGGDYPNYVDEPASPQDWCSAVLQAVSAPPAMEPRQVAYQRSVDQTWQAAFSTRRRSG